jgi:hypothetical protein
VRQLEIKVLDIVDARRNHFWPFEVSTVHTSLIENSMLQQFKENHKEKKSDNHS